MNTREQHVAIVGAGLSGSLLAIMLRKRGFQVSVFEKRIDPRTTSIAEGRSINLALSHRGIQALKAANAYDAIKDLMLPMSGRMMHDTAGNLTEQPYGKADQCINSISRNELNKSLIEQAEKAGVEFLFNHRCEQVNIQETQLVVGINSRFDTIKPDVIIGADGAFSVVRAAMMKLDRFDYRQDYITHGYKELSMPPLNGDFAMDNGHLHIWPRGSFMLIALPNPDKTFTCTLFYPFEGEQSFANLDSEEAITTFFQENFPDAAKLIPDLSEQFMSNPTGSLVTVRCKPWHHQRSLLIGDAAHAIVPFYGQGMNAAFEDCRLLVEMGDNLGYDWDSLFPAYIESRKKDADAIADLALANFTEMRDHVADEDFLLRKKQDARMHQQYGDDWIPMYTMVTFTDIPYSEALRKGRLQERALKAAQSAGKLEDSEYCFEQLGS